MRVLVEGICRAKLEERITEDTYMSCRVCELDENIEVEALSAKDKAAMRILNDNFVKYAALSGQVTDETVEKILSSQKANVVEEE